MWRSERLCAPRLQARCESIGRDRIRARRTWPSEKLSRLWRTPEASRRAHPLLKIFCSPFSLLLNNRCCQQVAHSDARLHVNVERKRGHLQQRSYVEDGLMFEINNLHRYGLRNARHSASARNLDIAGRQSTQDWRTCPASVAVNDQIHRRAVYRHLLCGINFHSRRAQVSSAYASAL